MTKFLEDYAWYRVLQVAVFILLTASFIVGLNDSLLSASANTLFWFIGILVLRKIILYTIFGARQPKNKNFEEKRWAVKYWKYWVLPAVLIPIFVLGLINFAFELRDFENSTVPQTVDSSVICSDAAGNDAVQGSLRWRVYYDECMKQYK